MKVIVTQLGCRILTAECEIMQSAAIVCAAIGNSDKLFAISGYISKAFQDFCEGGGFYSLTFSVDDMHMITVEFGERP